MLPIEVIIIRWQEFNLSRWLLTYNQTVECDISCIEIFSSFDLVIGGGSSIRQVYGGWRQWRTQIFPTAWATRARRVTHPMPVTLRRLLELKINRNRVLLSAVLCTSIVTLASGSPALRPGSPGLGFAIAHRVTSGCVGWWRVEYAREAWDRFEPRFTLVCIFCQKLYFDSRGACGGSWLVRTFFSFFCF